MFETGLNVYEIMVSGIPNIAPTSVKFEDDSFGVSTVIITITITTTLILDLSITINIRAEILCHPSTLEYSQHLPGEHVGCPACMADQS